MIDMRPWTNLITRHKRRRRNGCEPDRNRGLRALNREQYLALSIALALFGCDPEPVSNPVGSAAPTPHPSPIERVLFPDALRTGYDSVDAFIGEALATCVEGDYEAFRLLWNARQEPLRREEFDQGWQAVESVRVRAVEKVVVPAVLDEMAASDEQVDAGEPASDVSFALLVEARFDPEHPVGKRLVNREFVLLILRERNSWRLGRAPEGVRQWIKTRVAAADGKDAVPLEDEPAGQHLP